MEIRDPVHGFIDFNETEKGIINHPAFQRLRRIRQLGMSDLVYPGAVHQRFEHSLGVCHVARRIAERIFRGDSDAQRNIRLAALVHDIGHGPFSHVSEAPLAKVNAKWLEETGISQDKIHECIGVDIIKKEILGANKITESDASRMADILDTIHNPARSIERDVVSGPLDADKMDYLLRDSYYCGVQYGVYDIERLVRALVPLGHGQEQFLGVDYEDIPVVDQYVVARYNMHLQVYGHKTRRATDLMLGRAVMSAVESKDDQIVKAYTYEADCKKFTERYLKFDDRKLLDLLSGSKSKTAKKLSDSLMSRTLPSRVLYRPIDELSDQMLSERLRDKQKRSEAKSEVEKAIKDELKGFDDDYIFFEVSDAKEVGKFNTLATFDPNQIHVRSATARFSDLARESNFFRDYQFTSKVHLAVYVRLDAGPPASKDNNRKKVSEVLQGIIPFTENQATGEEEEGA